MRLLHRFLCGFPLWALGSAATLVGLAIAAAQVWPGAKRWDEAIGDRLVATVSEPLFIFLAVVVVALWGFATWYTWPARQAADQTRPERVARHTLGATVGEHFASVMQEMELDKKAE